MPIGLVSDDAFLKELSNTTEKKESHVVVVEKPVRGRKDGDVNVPDSLRALIGEESVINGRQSALEFASEFGISASSVSAYAKGATSTTTYDSPSKSIIGHINKSRQRAIKKASRTLNGALEAITQEKLDYADAKDLAVIAKNMSGIIKDLEPPADTARDDTASKSPQFVIFAPTFRSESSFEVIDVKE